MNLLVPDVGFLLHRRQGGCGILACTSADAADDSLILTYSWMELNKSNSCEHLNSIYLISSLFNIF